MATEESYKDACNQALAMIDAFVSVGVEQFDVIHTDINQQLRGYRVSQSARDVKRSIPWLVPGSYRRRNNLIVRPRKAQNGPILAQLDDLDWNRIQKIAPYAFLLVHTSPEKYQAWVAIVDGVKETVRQLVKGIGADPRASGAVRLAGTGNYKHHYEPDFPIVDAFGMKAVCMHSGQLKDLGLAPIPESSTWPKAPQRMARFNAGPRKWPSYSQALTGASLKPDGGRDRSQADFTWCMWAIDRGWSVDETVAELLCVSEKAQEQHRRKDIGYCRLTAWKASLAVQRNRGIPADSVELGQLNP